MVVDPFDPKKTLPRNPHRPVTAVAADEAVDNGAGGGGSPSGLGAGASMMEDLSVSMTTSISTPTSFADIDDEGATPFMSSSGTPNAASSMHGGRGGKRDGSGAPAANGVAFLSVGDYARRGSDEEDDFEEPNTWTQVSPSSTLRPTTTAQHGGDGGGAVGGSNNNATAEKNPKPKLVNAGKSKSEGKRDSAPEPDNAALTNVKPAAGADAGDSPCASPSSARRSPPPPPVPPRKPTPSPSPLNSPGGSPPVVRRPLPPPPPSNSHAGLGGGSASHSHHSHLSAVATAAAVSSSGSPVADSQLESAAASSTVAPPLPRARNARGAHCKETQTGKHGAAKMGGGSTENGSASRPNSVDLSATPPRHLPPPIPTVPAVSDTSTHSQHRHQQHAQDSQNHGGPSLPFASLTTSAHSRDSSSPRPAPPHPNSVLNHNNNYSKHGHNNTPPQHGDNGNNINNNVGTPPRSGAHDDVTPFDPSSGGAAGTAETNGSPDLMQLDSGGNSPPPFSPSGSASTTSTAAATAIAIYSNNNDSGSATDRSFHTSLISSSPSVHFDDPSFGGGGEPPAVPMRKTRPAGPTNRSQVSLPVNRHCDIVLG